MAKKRRRKRRNGEGSVYYRKDRKAWYVIFKAANGSRRNIRAEKCVDELAARAFLIEQLKIENEKLTEKEAPEHTTVSQIRESYISSLSIRACTDHINNVAMRLDLVGKSLNLKFLTDITAKKLESYRVKRLKEPVKWNENRLVSKRTVNLEVGALNAMLRWALQRGLIEVNPIEHVKPLRIKKHECAKIRRVLTPEEVDRLLNPENALNGTDLIWATFLGVNLD